MSAEKLLYVYLKRNAFHSNSIELNQRGDQLDCSPVNRTLLKCDLGNPFNSGKVEFQLRFNPTGLSDAETSLQMQIQTTT